MATVLSQQLQNISKAWGVAQGNVRGKPSLLFSPQQAADTDLRTIYNIGRQGECPELRALQSVSQLAGVGQLE